MTFSELVLIYSAYC